MNSLRSLLTLGMMVSTIVFSQTLQKVVPHNHSSPSVTCGFDEVHNERMLNDSQYRKIVEDFNRRWAEGEFHLSKKSAMAPVYQVPVVVHVLHEGEAVGTGFNISDQEVKNGIQYLNNYWRKVAGTYGDGPGADMEIEFALAVRDPSGNCTNGIVRRDMSANADYVNCGIERNGCVFGGNGITDATAKTGGWDQNEYYNIYLVNYIDGENCSVNSGGYIAGYAYFASSHGQTWDGTVCLICSYLDESSNTMAHEIGHAMNLYHTFQDACYSESNCATQGDRICDTHQHGVSECGGTTGCSATSGTIANGQSNYMSYCGSTSLFTADQKTRSTAALTVDRASFLESNGNLSLVPPSNATIDFYTQATAPCLNSTITFYDDSFCIPNTFSTNTGWTGHTFSWTFDNGVDAPYVSSDQNPTITFNNAGTYDVTLQITNGQGTFSTTKTGYITVSSGVSATACIPSSFNDDGNFGCGITNVTLNSINNSTSTYIPSNTGSMFHDYTCTATTSITESTPYTLSVTYQARPEFTQDIDVWIDWDNSGAFETSNANGDNENVLSDNVAAGGSETSSTSITAPAVVVTGQLLRMRVICEADGGPTLCGQGFIQEAEDYGVLVSPNNLPLNTIHISGQKNYNNDNIIKWQGEDDDNVISYDVQSSISGEHFETLYTAKFNGYMNVYNYTDERITQSKYYRVSANLVDGSTLKSKTIHLSHNPNNDWNIYPNPSNGELFISSKNKFSNVSVVVRNIYGQIVLNKPVSDNKVDMSKYSKGIYIVQLQNEEQILHTSKIILE